MLMKNCLKQLYEDAKNIKEKPILLISLFQSIPTELVIELIQMLRKNEYISRNPKRSTLNMALLN